MLHRSTMSSQELPSPAKGGHGEHAQNIGWKQHWKNLSVKWFHDPSALDPAGSMSLGSGNQTRTPKALATIPDGAPLTEDDEKEEQVEKKDDKPQAAAATPTASVAAPKKELTEEEKEAERKKKEVEKREKRERTRAKIRAELLATEKTYVDNLLTLITVYLAPLRLKKDILAPQEISDIFSNIELIYNLHVKFLGDLSTQSQKGTEWGGQAFLEFTPYFKLYVTYVNNHSKATATLNRLCAAKKG